MSQYNFPFGAEIIRPGMPICIYLGGGVCQHPQHGEWFMSDDNWELVKPDVQPEPEPESTRNMLPEPAHESDWSYAEAERLQKLAHEAIDAYNAYVEAKPSTVFLTIFK